MTKSKYRSGSNAVNLKSHNLHAILHSFLYNPNVSRAALAEKTMLSSTTITNLTAELLQEGIIFEETLSDHPQKRNVGRPRTSLRLNTTARLSIGVHIGIGAIRIAVTDLYGNIIAKNTKAFNLSDDAKIVLDQIAILIQQLLTENNIEHTKIVGVGIGASGLVDSALGINVLAPRLGWKNVPIQAILEEKLDLPVVIDNNVRTMALGEAMFGHGRDVDVLAFIYGRIGVGAGFVVNGEVYRGSGAGAGEIGHTILDPTNGAPCSCGNKGCLETILSEPIMVKEAEAIAKDNPTCKLNTLILSYPDKPRIELVFEAAKLEDELMTIFLKKKALYFGIALANLVNILNPELIIVGGIFANAGETFIQETEKVMKNHTFAKLGDKITLSPTKFGWNANVIGASALSLSNFFYNAYEE